ncbi:MAG: molybdopterin-dependent oxidoreductase, partial [Gammaproteobacteria bacterium]
MGTKRICSICEAGCGLIIDADGRKVVSIEANSDDVFSQGHVCAKGIALKDLDADPDRLRQPLLRRDGELQPVGWDEAFEFIAEKLGLFLDRSDPNAVAVYFGNPTAHNIGLSMGAGVFAGMLGSTNIYSAGSVDQLPKQLASALMFGSGMAVPVPDITRTDFLLMLGANPIVSNGSLWMVPGFRQKLRDLQRRGGRLVTIDPRRTETARLADAHHFIRPGTDAFLLAALINEIVQAGREPDVSVGVRHWQELKKALAPVSLALASERCGVNEDALRALMRQMLNAESPVVYGRVGTTLQQHGTLTSFLVEVLNMLLGALDRPGGAMFPEQPFTTARSGGESVSYNRWLSRVSGYPEVLGQMP